jgi:hypothetical protein
MMIHEDQKNVEALCEVANFIDSGFQSFRDQVKHLPPARFAEAAFYAGAGLAFKLQNHFEHSSKDHPPGAADYLLGIVAIEITEYMDGAGLRLEWEPHVPSGWKQ